MNRSVLLIGLVSLLNDAASEMIAPLMPIFLTVTLGGAPAWVGIIEGAADMAASLLKLYAGRLSDLTGRRKPWMVGGYLLVSITRPPLAFATAPWMVLALRVVDRVGKGVRTSPRDALLAESVAAKNHGFAFGFHRAMDHAGAFLGALIAWALLHQGMPIRDIFLWSAVPALVACAFAFGVPETRVAPSASVPLPPLPRSLRGVLLAVGILGLGQIGDAFLLLKAGEAGVPLESLPLLWMALHAVKSLASLGAGGLSDRVGRRPVILAGWCVRAVIYGMLAMAGSAEALAALFVVYGLYHGLTEGAEKALVAEMSTTASAFGWYHLTTGVVVLPAGILVGWLWTVAGAPVAFAYGTMMVLIAVVALTLAPRPAL